MAKSLIEQFIDGLPVDTNSLSHAEKESFLYDLAILERTANRMVQKAALAPAAKDLKKRIKDMQEQINKR